MATKTFVLENRNGQTVRVLNVQDEMLFVIYRRDTRRIEFVEDLSLFDHDGIDYHILYQGKVTDLKKSELDIASVGTLKYVSGVSDYPKEVEPTKEDENTYPIILKWTAISSVAGLILIFMTAWLIGRFLTKHEEPVVVQVFEQQQNIEKPKQKARTVEVAQKPIKQTKKIVKTVTHPVRRKVVVTSNASTHGKVKSRPGSNFNRVGALGALGGMGKNFNGSGGLNLNATKNNPGIGYGGMAAAGGLDKGLVGKGMISAGIGSGGNPRGFGGYGTQGRGGGKPGYGNMSMAGSSSGFFEPLAEEELVEGGLDRDQINAVIQRHIGQIIYCYEQGLQSKPSLSGRVAVKFVIGTTGGVNTARLANTSLGNSSVEGCIIAKLRGWQFPKPVGHVNVRVTYPFVLKRMSQG